MLIFPSPPLLVRLRIFSFVPLPHGAPQVLVAYWPHYIQYLLLTSVPHFLGQKILYDMHADIRKRALRKKQNTK